METGKFYQVTTPTYYSKDDALRIAIYTMLDLIESQVETNANDKIKKAISACEIALHFGNDIV